MFVPRLIPFAFPPFLDNPFCISLPRSIHTWFISHGLLVVCIGVKLIWKYISIYLFPTPCRVSFSPVNFFLRVLPSLPNLFLISLPQPLLIPFTYPSLNLFHVSLPPSISFVSKQVFQLICFFPFRVTVPPSLPYIPFAFPSLPNHCHSHFSSLISSYPFRISVSQSLSLP